MKTSLFAVSLIVLTVGSSSSAVERSLQSHLSLRGIQKHYEKHDTPQLHSGDDDRESVNIMVHIRRYILKHPKVIQMVEKFLRRLTVGELSREIYPTSDPWVCPGQEDTLCPVQPTEESPISASSDALIHDPLPVMWLDLVHKITTDPEGCPSCIDIWDFLRTLACGGLSWERIRDFLIPVCEEAFVESGDDPVMCNGSITLQGKHIYCIILEAESRDMCESLNSCYPPDPRVRPPVSERTPWAVRDKRHTKSESLRKTHTKNSARQHKAKEDLLMVAQLTDIHVQYKHVVGANNECNAYVCCLENSIGSGSARKYGEYLCNIPPRTLDLFLDRVRDADPEFVLYAGDSPPHTMWDETLTSQLNCSQLVVDAMKRVFDPDTRVYPNIGNHEMYPTNLYSLRLDETKTMTAEFVKMWHGLAGLDNTGNTTMRELGHYTTKVPGHPKLRILSINTNYDWYSMNFYHVLNQYTAENTHHKDWVINTLDAARVNSEKVIVIAHHPVGGVDAHVRSSRWWEEVANLYGDVIVLHVSGHTHRDHFKLTFDPDTMEVQNVNFVVATASSKTNVNPTMRMYYLDPADGYSLYDFESFYLDIKTQNDSLGVPPAIAFSYSAREEYGLNNLSSSSWVDLVLRFLDDDELFQTYYKNIRSHARDNSCDHYCKMDIICNLWFGEMSEVDECIRLAPPAPSIEPPTVSDGNVAISPDNLKFIVFVIIVQYFINK